MGALLNDQTEDKYYDVTFKVEDKEINAHRNILAVK